MKPERIDTSDRSGSSYNPYQTVPIVEDSSNKVSNDIKQLTNQSNKYNIFDVVGTWHIFSLLILPLTVALLVALIPNDWKYNTTIIPLLPSRDVVDQSVSNAMSSSSTSSSSSVLHSHIRVVHKVKDGFHELHTDINILAYVKSYVQMPLVNVSVNVCNSTDTVVDSEPLTGFIGVTSRLFDHRYITNISIPYSAVLSNDTIALSDFQLFSQNCSQVLSRAAEPLSSETNLMMPLWMQSFDTPHILTGDNHWLAFHFQAIDISDQLRTMPEYVLITHNSDYNEFICLCGLAISLFTFVYLIYAVAVIVRHAWHQNKDRIAEASNTNSENSGSDGPSRGWSTQCQFCCQWSEMLLSTVTAEQYISVLLLISLFFWQNPFRCCYVLYHYWYYGVPSNSGLLLTGISSGLSYFGLQCFLALYISSLKFSKLAQTLEDSVRTTPNSGSNPHTPLSQSGVASYGSRQSFPPKAFTHFSPTTAHNQSDSYNSQFWLYSSSQQWTDRYRNEYDRVAAAENRKRLHEEEQRYLLVNYTVNKVLLLLGTWVLVVIYWTMKFPELCRRVFTISDNSSDDSLAYKVCYSVVEISLIGLSLMWIKIVFNSLYSTAVKLKKSNYLSNRFHQIAYILIVAQINLGMLIFFVCAAWNISSMGIYSSGFLLYGRYKAWDWVIYAIRWLDYAGGLRALISAGPLSPPSMSLFMFVSTLIYTIVYITLPVSINLAGDNDDMGRYVGENRSYYINLERYDHLRSFNVVKKMSVAQRRTTHQHMRKLLLEHEYAQFMKRYIAWKSVSRRSSVFCLETACLLLEASYQAYFPAKRAAIPVGPSLSRKNSEKSPLSVGSTDKNFKTSSTHTSSNTPSLAGEAVSGPVLDLSKLGLELVDTFQEASVSTFGYIGLNYTVLSEEQTSGKDTFQYSMRKELSGAVVAFRGSTAANFVIDFKFALIPLPEMKHSRAYFVDIFRTGLKSEPDSSQADTNCAKNVEVSKSKSYHDFTEMLDAMESGMEGTADDHSRKYYQLNSGSDGKDPTRHGSDGVKDSPPQTMLRQMKTVGTTIPLVKEGFPRVHAGFWQAYASIREQVLISVVKVIAQHRQQYCCALGQDGFITGSEVDLSASDSDLATGIEMQPTSQKSSKKHDAMSDLALDLSEIRPLQLYFTGHSLGGTMASLAALDVATNMDTILEALCYMDYIKPQLGQNVSSSDPVADQSLRAGLSNLSYLRTWMTPELSIYTYGCPRIGNLAFMQLMKRSVETNYRVQLNGDLVPMVPKIPGYYYHSGVNVIIDEEERGSLIVKPSLVEQWMLRSATGSLNNHSLDKYRDCLESCFEEHELKEYLSKALIAAEDSPYRLESGVLEGLDGVGGSGVGRNSTGGRNSIGSSSGGGNRRVSLGKAVEVPDWLISDR